MACPLYFKRPPFLGKPLFLTKPVIREAYKESSYEHESTFTCNFPQRKHQIKMRSQVSIILSLLMILMGKHFAKSSFDTCITNCVQCKQMYGHRFAGKMCGDTCIASNGEFFLDCNNPGMIHDYLKRLYRK